MASSHSQANFSGSNRGTQIGQQFNYSGGDLHTQILQSFSSEYRKQKNINPKRVQGTCEWFLTDERFHEWRDTDEPRLIHVYAGPGCGKSVLARCLIDEKLVSNSNTSAVLYFFFKDGQGSQDRSATAITALLHQLYANPNTMASISHAELAYRSHGSKLCTMFEDLWDVLVDSVASINGNVVCVLDALDECRKEDRTILLDTISAFYSDLEICKSGRLKFALTSRPYPDIRLDPADDSDRTSFVIFDGDEKSELIAREINLMIEVEVPRTIPRAYPSVQQALIEFLQGRENRTYLWLHLTLDFIKKNLAGRCTVSGLRELLRRIPPTVEDAYEQMLNRTSDKNLTTRLLVIVFRAYRPLTIPEAKWALALADNNLVSSDNVEVETDDQFKDTIKELCGLLLTVYDFEIHFIHETAREFVSFDDSLKSRERRERVTSLSLGKPLKSWKGIAEAECDSTMAFVCAKYLTVLDVESLTPNELDFEFEPSIMAQLAFLSYAATHWYDHFESFQPYSELAGDNTRAKILMCMEKAVHHLAAKSLLEPTSFINMYLPSFKVQLLAAAIRFGLLDFARELLLSGVHPANYRHIETHYSLLHLAAERGHEEGVSLLLEYGSDPNSKDTHGRTPLMFSMMSPNEKIVRKLLDHGANVNEGERFGDKPLDWAVVSADTTLVALLLERGANVFARGWRGTPLQIARRGGHDDIVQLLIAHGAASEEDIDESSYPKGSEDKQTE